MEVIIKVLALVGAVTIAVWILRSYHAWVWEKVSHIAHEKSVDQVNWMETRLRIDINELYHRVEEIKQKEANHAGK